MASGSRFGGDAATAEPVEIGLQLMAAHGRGRVGLGGALGILLVSTGLVAHGFRIEHRSLRPTPHVPELPASLHRLGVQSTRWTGPKGQLAGWIHHGRSGAGILLLHGSGGSRADFRAEVEILAAAGFSVLSMDLGGHGESDGEGSYGQDQRENVKSALTFLASQPEVADGRFGALGFSLGGYLLAQVLAEEPRISAAVLSGAPSDLQRHADLEYAHLTPLGRFGAGLAMRFHGLGPNEPSALEALSRDARPVLFVIGQKDRVVPLQLQEALYLASGSQEKSKLILPNSAHGDYASTAPLLYASELVAFFSHHLLLDRVGSQKAPVALADRSTDAEKGRP